MKFTVSLNVDERGEIFLCSKDRTQNVKEYKRLTSSLQSSLLDCRYSLDLIFAVSQIKLVVAVTPVVKQTKLEAMNKKTL